MRIDDVLKGDANITVDVVYWVNSPETHLNIRMSSSSIFE